MPNHDIRPRRRLRQCAYCDRVFTKEEHLKRHQRAHTGEKPFKCHKCGRSYARSDVLFRHLQTHPPSNDGHDQQPPRIGRDKTSNDQARHLCLDVIVVRDCDTSSANKEASVAIPEQSSNTTPDARLPTTRTNVSQLPPPQPRPADHDTDMITSPADFHLPHISPRFDLDEYEYEQDRNMGSSADPIPKGVPRPADAENSDAASGRICNNDMGKSKSLPHEIIQAQAVDSLQNIRNSRTENLEDLPPFAMPQPFEPQPNIDAPSNFAIQENSRPCRFPENEQFDMFSFDMDQIPFSSEIHMGFSGIDSLGLESSDFQFAMPAMDTESSSSDSTSSGLMAISTGQIKQIRKVWSRQRPKKPARLINRLWNQVVNHDADNVFTTPHVPGHGSMTRSSQTSKSSIDEGCRSRLMQYCKELDVSFPLSSTAPDHAFPVVEILDSSLDFFFQFFHPILPFIHKSTFDARHTPSPLLLAMCLVGLSYLDRVQTKAFVSRYLKQFLLACLNDITSRALTQPMPFDLLTTLATALIVAYLALGFRDEIEEYQAYMLCTQALRTADKQGLFAAKQGDDLAVQLRQGPSEPDGFWKAWARVESIKRLIFCFTWLDMAYARLMDTAGVVEIDKVELHLPCDEALFDGSTTATSFLRAIQRGARLTMPRMNICDFHATSSSQLNENSAQVLLRALYLRVTAARTRLLDTDSHCLELHSASPVEELIMDSHAKGIIADVVLLPKTHAGVLGGKNSVNALGWNYLCITLTADVDLLEVASGRDGLEAASAALAHVAKWSKSSSARRAVLHAAQVFDILDSCRIRESYLTRPDLVLFVSALVISQYVLVSNYEDGSLDVPPFELLQDIDWTIVSDEGLGTATGCILSNLALNHDQRSAASSATRHFLRHGGPVSFAGEAQGLGDVAARKMARRFAHLMDGFGRWDGCNYSQLLRAICGFTND